MARQQAGLAEVSGPKAEVKSPDPARCGGGASTARRTNSASGSHGVHSHVLERQPFVRCFRVRCLGGVMCVFAPLGKCIFTQGATQTPRHGGSVDQGEPGRAETLGERGGVRARRVASEPAFPCARLQPATASPMVLEVAFHLSRGRYLVHITAVCVDVQTRAACLCSGHNNNQAGGGTGTGAVEIYSTSRPCRSRSICSVVATAVLSTNHSPGARSSTNPNRVPASVASCTLLAACFVPTTHRA